MTHMADDGAGSVLVERAAGVATITLNRPRTKNAMSWPAWDRLSAAVRSVDPVVDRVVVITGAGEDFCAGADLSGAASGRSQLDDMGVLTELCLALHRLPMPTIARVDGVAVGAGMNLALVCDFVIASTRARFSQIFVQRALSVDFGGSWLLPRLVGLRRAKELVLLGDIIDARRARELGLLHEVVDADKLDAAVADLADRLASGPRLALRGSKALLNSSLDLTLEQALDNEARTQVISMASPDITEALEAFQQRRPANYRASHEEK
ncbi:enoyl-CoA hydratase-related protein [Streptomyces sp. NPDC051985]|uniref:enoyl-CoA hydratase/isomerase family protein n=1 Tax=Streptomyces sp. NPDC051985 TaxID=3155807 RepID=UPI0034426714